MDGQQAVGLIDRLLEQHQQRKLNDLESIVMLHIWEGSTYQKIADQLSYELDYIKQVAARLWKALSKLLGESGKAGKHQQNQHQICVRTLSKINVNLPSSIICRASKYR